MTGYLLDTHSAIWWWTDDRKLSRAARSAIEANDRPVWVSAVSALEIALKWRLGRLPMIGDPRDNYAPLMAANGFGEIVVSSEHAIRAGVLGGDHRDPFDRLIAAQGLILDLVVITRDRAMIDFGCEVLW